MYKIFSNIYSNIALSGYNKWVFVVIILFSISCGNDNNNQYQEKKFYDVKGFIEGQVAQLNKEKPVVSKVMEIGKDKNQLNTREVDWKKELELFVQADINKPAYNQSYEVIRSDSSTYEYVIKQGENLPISHLKIQLNEAGGLPVRIEATLKSENKLYQSEKNISLKCVVTGNSAQIISYYISGFQKLATMHEKPFLVEAKIQH